MPSAILRRSPMTRCPRCRFGRPWRRPMGIVGVAAAAPPAMCRSRSAWLMRPAGPELHQLEVDVGGTGSLANGWRGEGLRAGSTSHRSGGCWRSGSRGGCGCRLGRLFFCHGRSDFLNGRCFFSHRFRGGRSVAFTLNVKHDADATDGKDVAGFTDDAGHGSVAGCRNFHGGFVGHHGQNGVVFLDGVTDGDHPLNDFTQRHLRRCRAATQIFPCSHSSCVLCMASAMRDGLGR